MFKKDRFNNEQLLTLLAHNQTVTNNQPLTITLTFIYEEPVEVLTLHHLLYRCRIDLESYNKPYNEATRAVL